jgi:hypothetical protein
MSFSFGVGDGILIVERTRELIQSVRNAPREFVELSGLAESLCHEVEDLRNIPIETQLTRNLTMRLQIVTTDYTILLNQFSGLIKKFGSQLSIRKKKHEEEAAMVEREDEHPQDSIHHTNQCSASISHRHFKVEFPSVYDQNMN